MYYYVRNISSVMRPEYTCTCLYRSYGSFSETGVDIVIILLIYFVLYTNDIMLKRYDNV